MTEIDTAQPTRLTPMDVWENLTDGAMVVGGGDLEKANALVGVPFLVSLITLRKGDYLHGRFKDGRLIPDTGCGQSHPYASINVTTAPKSIIDRAYERMVRRAKKDEHPEYPSVGPLEDLILNLAGTGAYRQLLEFCEVQELIAFPDAPKNGPFGEVRYDSLPAQWNPGEKFADAGGEWRVNIDGDPVISVPVRLVCPRGLRASEYENEYTKDGRTFYLG